MGQVLRTAAHRLSSLMGDAARNRSALVRLSSSGEAGDALPDESQEHGQELGEGPK